MMSWIRSRVSDPVLTDLLMVDRPSAEEAVALESTSAVHADGSSVTASSADGVSTTTALHADGTTITVVTEGDTTSTTIVHADGSTFTTATTRQVTKDELSDVGGFPYLRDLTCDAVDEGSVRRTALAICPHLWQLNAAEALPVVAVTGGLTNKLLRVGDVLVRVYGGEGMVDRDVETPTFEALAEWLGPPRYLGRFANGRVEEFLQVRTAATELPSDIRETRHRTDAIPK